MIYCVLHIKDGIIYDYKSFNDEKSSNNYFYKICNGDGCIIQGKIIDGFLP